MNTLGEEMRILSLACGLVILLSGCAGEMTGQIRGSGERITFTYEQGLDSDTYSAVIGGEKFVGKAVMDGSTSGVGTVFGAGLDATVFGATTTNRFVAVLLGDKGNSLNCQMRYADSSGFTTSGGVGICQHSDGRVIDVLW
jgi:hypothetical protein